MKRISAIIASEMAETYLSPSSSTTSQLPQDRPVCLLALNSSAFFHKTYKHNCKSALPTCVYMHLTVNKACFCALLNRRSMETDSWKLSNMPICIVHGNCTFSKPDTVCCHPPSNTLQGLIPTSSFVTQAQENIVSLTEASAPLLVRRGLWSR